LNRTIPIADLKGAMQSIRLEEVIEQPNAAAQRSALAQVFSALMEDFAPLDQVAPTFG
jgi:hypothetical protein